MLEPDELARLLDREVRRDTRIDGEDVDASTEAMPGRITLDGESESS